ncbi:phosphoribosylformylglycinamidine synthase subunit PurS [Campylobacter hyointestinalis]|uniref:phosphoribosylformylglycinamidine synthase subunit PurS n=1 Tax=Campylobacter hyointestinalis TaxID=198 RepID=UPI000DCCFE7B|nr:phosphoribosylformylglycinamidine synthase subunit PurS [Campylobacter hyointestinalis]RAZ48453.1 phosphoribosylformylglycinamidine synthase [Campylobacter hyointestinalis subsp. lawsonii]RAZ60178.1 phosphoribosylformylglycinamidine synthase [Campylobacter hyointestinalis subsp. lawsonii]
MKVIINVFLKNGVLDPAGKAVEHALNSLGFDGVNEVRIGKQIVLNLKDGISDADIKTMCEELLANTVIEDYEIIKG